LASIFQPPISGRAAARPGSNFSPHATRFVIMGATHGKAPVGFAPIAIGLCLTLIHLIGIPVTNVSVNPARSTGPALFVGGWALAQLWLFWLAPLLGGAAGGVLYRWLSQEPSAQVIGIPTQDALGDPGGLRGSRSRWS
jgi:hypothetical protein